jgi:hypothetical protein
LKVAIERVDVFGAKRLEWKMTEPRNQVVVRDGGPGADDLKRRLVPDRRGGDRRPKQQGT